MRRTQLTERRTTGGKRGERNKLFKITNHGGTLTFKRTAVLFVVVGLCLRASGDSVSQEERCEDGWTFLDEACYLFGTCLLNWNSAKQACEKAGAQLLVIKSSAQYNAVTGEMGKIQRRTDIWYWWIGLQRNATSDNATSGWQWVDQSPLSEDIPKWGQGEPNNNGGNEFCGEIFLPRWMNDVNCYWHRPYICEKVPQLLSSSVWMSTTSMTVASFTVRNKDDEGDVSPVDNSTVRNKDGEHDVSPADNSTVRNKDGEDDVSPVDNSTVRNKDCEQGDCPPRIAVIASEVAVGLVIIVIIVVLILVKRRRGAGSHQTKGTQSDETVPPAVPEEIRTVALPEGNQGPRPDQEEAEETYENMVVDEVGQRSMYTTYRSHRRQPAPRVMPPPKDQQEEEVYEIV